jgi:hypothetical protein
MESRVTSGKTKVRTDDKSVAFGNKQAGIALTSNSVTMADRICFS